MDLEFHPLAAIFPLMQPAEFAELVADIKANGIRDEIVVLDGKILDGRNRHLACQEAGVKGVYATFDPEVDGPDPLAFVISHNIKRRHLSETQRGMVAANLCTMPLGGAFYRTARLPTDRPLISQAQAAQMVGVSERTVRDCVRIKNEGSPELSDAARGGQIPASVAAKATQLPPDQQVAIAKAAEAGNTRAASTVVKKAARAKRETDLAAAQLALPAKRYGVILADPPWSFEVWAAETGMDRAADNHYPTSTIEDIKATDIGSIAADDCVLFLWATSPMLPHALMVMAAWGFEYKSSAVWIKTKDGTGYWFRNRHELLLVGTKGNIPAPAMGTQDSSVIEAPARTHSEKPDEAYELIEKYFPTVPRIELNARRKRAGWDAHGTLEREIRLENPIVNSRPVNKRKTPPPGGGSGALTSSR
jgi:N6-adenosine-specific RNA methylase IME4